MHIKNFVIASPLKCPPHIPSCVDVIAIYESSHSKKYNMGIP